MHFLKLRVFSKIYNIINNYNINTFIITIDIMIERNKKMFIHIKLIAKELLLIFFKRDYKYRLTYFIVNIY